MKTAVALSNNYFLALAFIFVWTVEEASPCDTKWIRLVYMMSCGKKKRESVWYQNDTFYENLPADFDGALKYFKDKDPLNPVFSDALLYEILEEDGGFSSESITEISGENSDASRQIPKLLIYDKEEKKDPPKTSILLQKLLPGTTEKGNRLEIQGFPAQWDVQELIDDKISENHRREIDRLIEECCKVPPVTSCNGNTFLGACK